MSPIDQRSHPDPARPDPVPTRQHSWRPWVSTVARVALAAVFGVASLAKIGNTEAMVRAVRAYQILPESAVRPVAYALPYLELAVAVLLLIGVGTRLVAAVAAVMLVLFIAAVSSAGLRGLRIDCGCFGSGGVVVHTHYLQEIARDLGFLLLAAWLLVYPVSRLSVDELISEDI
ncbi:MAG TPA: MauE/DoxX family redox-associated membrane protein [Frankiaceae bacterium]|nr:MauE/DoxX family redox-associated membrane protein [Frankiaceae bacterium]